LKQHIRYKTVLIRLNRAYPLDFLVLLWLQWLISSMCKHINNFNVINEFQNKVMPHTWRTINKKRKNNVQEYSTLSQWLNFSQRFLRCHENLSTIVQISFQRWYIWEKETQRNENIDKRNRLDLFPSLYIYSFKSNRSTRHNRMTTRFWLRFIQVDNNILLKHEHNSLRIKSIRPPRNSMC
jgi:hypothetical protein